MPTVNLNQPQKKAQVSADMVRTYLREIGRVSLLTHEEEIIFGKQVQRMMQLLEHKEALEETLDREATMAEWATAANVTEKELKRDLKVGERAKRKMIEANLRLVVAIAKKYQKRNLEFLDLIQELGRAATIAEIAEELELEPAQIREYFRISRHPISLDVRVGDNQDTELSDLLEDDSESPDTNVTYELLKQDLKELISDLTPQQQEVIILRFGLNDGKELSLAKIGKRMNLSRERVRQLERQALTHLRRRRSQIREYIAAS